jgi:hypothetical protein
MKKLLLIILLFAGLTGFKQGNTRRISGTVYGKDDGKPIAGASISIQGTNTGTLTDISGDYTIDVPSGNERLIFSYIGYQAKSVKIGKKYMLNVYLEPSSAILDEVVVTGYTSKKKKSVAASVESISPEGDVLKTYRMLQGQATGVPVNGRTPSQVNRLYNSNINNQADPEHES